MPHTVRRAAPLARGTGGRFCDDVCRSVLKPVPSAYAPVALKCWGNQILRGRSPEDKGDHVELSIFILSFVEDRPREVPTC